MVKKTKKHNGVKSIVAVYNLASQADINSGLDWYRSANSYAQQLSEIYSIDRLTIVAVIASLSPRNKWERNKVDAETMVKVFSSGGNLDDLLNLKVCTFGAGKKKAARILVNNITNRDELLTILNGPKLQEFFNIRADRDGIPWPRLCIGPV